jgi:hypothetical protein
MLCYLGLSRDPRNLKSPTHCERARPSPQSDTTLIVVCNVVSIRLSKGLVECLTFMPYFTLR